ncbi:hypothetical protein MVEN_00354000 [Mycena venus]|uniref:DUF6533 domain-containing protein n=1 Tax=Mycena venus TaxID=2733690 RepID=A0A8H6YTZ7_9AGAR|nr:hypothetical protein MVEN_00354000 [Mycena venus]
MKTRGHFMNISRVDTCLPYNHLTDQRQSVDHQQWVLSVGSSFLESPRASSHAKPYSSLPPPVMASESEIANTLLFLRFFTAFGLASIAYDHCLTLGMEFKVIWMNPKTGWASKAAFWLNRYLTEVIIAYTVYIFSGSYVQLNDAVSDFNFIWPIKFPIHLGQLCGQFLWIFGSAAIVFGAVTHSIVVLRVYALWDQRTNVARALTVTFFICIVATAAIGIACELKLQPLFKFSPFFTTCILSSMPRLISVAFAVQTFFDVLILVITVYNALERPHRNHSEVITSLANDGFKFILAILFLRSLYLVTSLVGNPGECFATVATCWGFTSIITARLHLRLDSLALKADAGSDIPLPLSLDHSLVRDSSWWDR